jgi:hypothetical protein
MPSDFPVDHTLPPMKLGGVLLVLGKQLWQEAEEDSATVGGRLQLEELLKKKVKPRAHQQSL